jgi:hypothetical protein
MGAGEIAFWIIVIAGFSAVMMFALRPRGPKTRSVSFASAATPSALARGGHAAVVNGLSAKALGPLTPAAASGAVARCDPRGRVATAFARADVALSLSQDAMLDLIQLCDDAPQEGLRRIDGLDAQTQRHPLVRFARVVAYRRLIYGAPDVFARRFGEDFEAFMRSVGRTEIDLAARALSEIAEIEQDEPDFFDDEGTDIVANAICFVIERKRPASVQKGLGWTRLAFFGPQRLLAVTEENPITEQLKDVPETAMAAMLMTRFSCAPIVRLAVAVAGRQVPGDGWLVLFGLFENEAVPRGGKLGDAKLVGFLTASERGRWRFDPPSNSSLSFAPAGDGLRQDLLQSELSRVESLLERIDGRLSGGYGEDAGRALNTVNRNLERVLSELRDISRKLK